MTDEQNTSSSAENKKEHEETNESAPQEQTEQEATPSSDENAATAEPNTSSTEELEQSKAAENDSAEEDSAKQQKEETKDFSFLKPGMTVKVHQKIQEAGKKKGETKERIQIFEGMIIAIRGAGVSKTITVRKVSGGIGVEKIFPLHLPTIAKIEPIKQARVRRAKLYYLRDHKKKLKERKVKKG